MFFVPGLSRHNEIENSLKCCNHWRYHTTHLDKLSQTGPCHADELTLCFNAFTNSTKTLSSFAIIMMLPVRAHTHTHTLICLGKNPIGNGEGNQHANIKYTWNGQYARHLCSFDWNLMTLLSECQCHTDENTEDEISKATEQFAVSLLRKVCHMILTTKVILMLSKCLWRISNTVAFEYYGNEMSILPIFKIV